MNDFYTFIISSSINIGHLSDVNIIDKETRFNETLKTIESIKTKITNVKIVLVDNSSQQLDNKLVEILSNKVNIFHQVEHNIFTLFSNNIGSKGIGEAYIMSVALSLIKQNNLIGKRIFKITGRYLLADSFDIKIYDDFSFIGSYAFKINQWDVSSDNFINHRETVTYFETRLWSFCYQLFDEYIKLLDKIFAMMVSNIGRPLCNYERSHYYTIPHDKVVEIKTMHVEGITANTGVYKFE